VTLGERRGLDLLRRWARLFDSAFQIPGTSIRFGIDPILGLVPGVGDLASPVLSLFMIWHGAKLGVPKVVLARMAFNAVIGRRPGRRRSLRLRLEGHRVEPRAPRAPRDSRSARDLLRLSFRDSLLPRGGRGRRAADPPDPVGLHVARAAVLLIREHQWRHER
jgi:hypothetical protein